MEKTYAIYRVFLNHDENPDIPKLQLTKHSEDFNSENDAIKHLEKNDFAGGDYMILPSFYKHQPDID